MLTDAILRRQAEIYRALPEYRGRLSALSREPGTPPEGTDLTPYELQVFSQNGEDGVLAEILRRIGVADRTFVEFGVETGAEGNCVALADVDGWRGLFMEADGKHFHHLHRKYRPNQRVQTLHAAVTPQTVQELFAQAGVPPEPDVLSIDVDGADYWIWHAITGYRPRVVVIEYNAGLDPDARLVQPRDTKAWDGSDFFGASLGALIALAARKGYRLVHCELAGVNAFFVRDDQSGTFGDEVTRRGPNYYLNSLGHPADRRNRRYDQV